MTQSRYIVARVVDFDTIEFGGDDIGAAKKKPSAKDRKIRRLLRRARKLKTRIRHLQIRKPLGWKGALKSAKTNLKVVMSDLKEAGWKPKKPTRAKKPGEDDEDAQLDDIPDAEPGEKDEPDDEEIDEIPDATTEGNWLDGYVGIEGARPKKNLWKEAGKLFKPGWGPHKPLGDAARIQAKGGNQVMVATVSPGLFIVQVVSDGAAKKIAGDNVGVLPLLLYPLVKQRIQQKFAPQPAPPAPGPVPAPVAPPAEVGCDGRPCRCGS